MSMLEEYPFYDTLPAGKWTRIVLLEPGTYDDPIQCSLYLTPLQSAGKDFLFLDTTRPIIRKTDMHMRFKNTKQYLTPGAAQQMSALLPARVLRLMSQQISFKLCVRSGMNANRDIFGSMRFASIKATSKRRVFMST